MKDHLDIGAISDPASVPLREITCIERPSISVPLREFACIERPPLYRGHLNCCIYSFKGIPLKDQLSIAILRWYFYPASVPLREFTCIKRPP